MKKSFLKTFIVFGLLSFCMFFGLMNIASSQVPNYSDPNAATANQAAQANVQANNQAKSSFTLNPIKALGNTVADTAMSLIQTAGVAFLALCNFILWLSGVVFDKILEKTIISSELFDLVKPSVQDAWKIIRDLANITIVFSLLYLAIRTILNGNGFAETKTLAGILVAAILINFSLFFTMLAFDTSNFLARSIADQIKFNGGGNVTNVSGNLVNIIGLKDSSNKLWDAKGTQAGFARAFADLQGGVLTGFTALVVAGILAAASLMFLYRFFVFICLMITAPVGLVSVFIPWFKSVGDKWWGQLKHQFLFLPVFMITLYISLLFIGSLTKDISSPDLIMFIFNFILICGFLLAILIVPSKISGGGANMMTNIGGWGATKLKNLPRSSAQFAGRKALDTTARGSRYIVGNKLANIVGGGKNEASIKALQEKARGTGMDGAIARQRLKASEGLKNRTFDVRNTSAGKNLKLGNGIESWNKAVKTKQDKLKEDKEKEEKLFGYNNVSRENVNETLVAEADRDTHAKEVEKADAEFKRANAAHRAMATNSTATQVQKDQAEAEMKQKLEAKKAQQKKLEELELAVGKAKNKGEVEYMKLVKKRNQRMWNRMSATQQEAAEKFDKEMEKKWKEEGKSKKKKKPATPSPNTSTSIGNGGGVSGSI